MAEDTQGFLSYKSVDIYFIFSFALDYQDAASEPLVKRMQEAGWQEGLPLDRQGRPPFLSIKKRVGEALRSTTWCKLVLPRTRARLVYRESFSGAARADQFDTHVEAWARTFDSGAGCITFKVSLDEDVTFRRIYEAHSLSQRLFDHETSYAALHIDGQEGNLFHFFRTFLRKEFDTDHAGEPITLLDEEVLDFDDAELDAQNPYVLSAVELQPGDADPHFLGKSPTKTLRFKELASILFRLVYHPSFFEDVCRNLEFVQIPSELLDDGLLLRNFSWDSRSLMCFCRTSSLFACLDDKDQVPAALIRNSLLDTLEIVRARWHMSILLNAQLDGDLEDFRKYEEGDTLFVLHQLVKRRRQFAVFLHDPLPYSFEGGSVSMVADLAAKELQLPELRRMTFEKLATLDQLHSDQMKLARLYDYQAFRAPAG
jgi:hypothetical protein